jgi:Putative beta-barrel porin-2, OmpL-like. bbp2
LTRGPAIVLILFNAGRVLAGGGPATDAYDDISKTATLDPHLLADAYLGHDFNQPSSGTEQLIEFDANSDRPTLNFLRLTLAHRPRRLGFRIDAGFGETSRVFFDADPAHVAHPGQARFWSHVEQAFFTVVVPIGTGLSIDTGKFNTPVGFEDNELTGNWNYSRSFAFGMAEPSLHVGVRASYQWKRLAASLFCLNGWNANFVDGNQLRELAGALEWKPNETFSIYVVYVGGLERAPTRLSVPILTWRNVVNVSFTYSPVKRVSFALNVDYGTDRAGGGVSFGSAAGYARFEPRPWLVLAVRGEYYADPDGFTTGTRQDLAELTTTIWFQSTIGRVHVAAIPEYRHDQSNARVFEGAAPPARARQDTLTLALAAWF